MTGAQDITIRTRWNEACAEFDDATAAVTAAEAGNEDDHPAEDAARHAAFLTLIHTPVPDAEALQIKLAALLAGSVAEETGGNIDNLADLQWMLDDATAEDSAGHLVSVWQDAGRLAGDDHPALALSPISAKPWSEVAAIYREALAAYMATLNGCTDDTPDDVMEEAERVIRPIYNGMLRWPVWSVEQLAEKAELIALDCRDEGVSLKALTADAARIARL